MFSCDPFLSLSFLMILIKRLQFLHSKKQIYEKSFQKYSVFKFKLYNVMKQLYNVMNLLINELIKTILYIFSTYLNFISVS